MSLYEWLSTKRSLITEKNIKQVNFKIPDGLWIKCTKCGLLMHSKTLQKNYKVCPQCGHHFPTSSHDRLQQILDGGSWEPINSNLSSTDPLGFSDQKLYASRLKDIKEKLGLTDAIQTGLGTIGGIKVAFGVMDFRFMGGSMGSVVGEKLTRLIEKATSMKLPLLVICASGGARMQEGMLSLMQMAKVSSALHIHKKLGLLYMSILTSPTTGGVTASFAMLGDLILAEPNALIAFAGRRVIEQTIRQDLPNNFQTSEYLFQHGFIDLVIARTQLKTRLVQLLGFYVQ
uniref:Acetyl-coenzyme A carboxylase carboxyl transferase subunit beta n=1 Tax=Neogoniolithon spectabile TaxID=231755 RepID=A0A3G3MH62_9FLOR|nr:acetyl-CoA carboxylase beta subunit [Neogoniolithon spectabile]AYR06157.1 acetyl-CoA carboxylase beta subunit [Neogoniolithon spectabile]